MVVSGLVLALSRADFDFARFMPIPTGTGFGEDVANMHAPEMTGCL